jgi:hypothetical protein
VDDRHEFAPVGEETVDGSNAVIPLDMPSSSVCYLRFSSGKKN